jgi:hypothetical protein
MAEKTKQYQHIGIDLEKARKLGMTVNVDNSMLHIEFETRPINMDNVIMALTDADFNGAEIDMVISSIYEISQIKVLKKLMC